MTAVLSTCNNRLPGALDGGLLLHSNTCPTTRPVPFPLPKKLDSDRLLLVSNALHETPTYKSLSPELLKQRDSLKPSNHSNRSVEKKRKIRFRSVDQVHEYSKDYDEWDYDRLWFSSQEFADIFERDDEDFKVCFSSMAHTKHILQLWGVCSRTQPKDTEELVDTLFRDAPHPHARGLEHRIITGIRNHRQKAVQSFLQQQHNNNKEEVCPRYLKFSQTASRFAQVLAAGDARVAQLIQSEAEEEEEDWGYQ